MLSARTPTPVEIKIGTVQSYNLSVLIDFVQIFLFLSIDTVIRSSLIDQECVLSFYRNQISEIPSSLCKNLDLSKIPFVHVLFRKTTIVN